MGSMLLFRAQLLKKGQSVIECLVGQLEGFLGVLALLVIEDSMIEHYGQVEGLRWTHPILAAKFEGFFIILQSFVCGVTFLAEIS